MYVAKGVLGLLVDLYSSSCHLSLCPVGHQNVAYPASVTITAPAGVTLEKGTVSKTDAGVSWTEVGADFPINFTASTVGKKSFTGYAKFSPCEGS